ncbi:UDP-N-acetylmuramoyl-L-alanine--D-glutamate ligase [Caldisericum exile]|uniref:UDP-N-acetylmuramoylalanine--D-glutamate ligase n=1 Tax=Caldisericum exile (strain DSM 21853 / NBRC 104410 / AZM16c01) TaxID=511051 RepID=A0A7U6GF92_CALEA|nr:UDP-N-acetylmuramoyl-L-alanine--D-glutamate ligase [Caldisericum exile]BAL81309.1 UDP-N-acetylmuramoylalanine--D-glutamate ligase [Caldisericum exile AZM16c01]
MKILVVGARRSGVFASILGKLHGFEVFLTEKAENSEVRSFEPLLKKYNIPYEIGKHSFEKFSNFDLAVLSPGIPMSAPIVKDLESKGIKIIGELEFANMFSPNTKIIAITGTNGKSTTTALTGHIFKLFNQNTVVGGNLGTPYSELLLENPNPEYAVLETSCFQLETIEQYHPEVSVFLNFTEDHLDRYTSMEDYLKAKKRIFINQTESDFAILNYDDEVVKNLSKEIKPQVYYFSLKESIESGAFLKDNKIYFREDKFSKPKEIIEKEEIPLLGLHNVQNTLASILCSIVMGVPVEVIRDGIRTFKGLPHRLEFVREVNGVIFINDSKSTTPDSTIKALESFNQKVILIAGGSSKNNDFTQLAKMFRDKVKFLILLGQTAHQLKEASTKADFHDFAIVGSLKEAITFARNIAKAGDIVLLSPACASFDMFRDFEDRGEQFKEIVSEL